jgi:hypothetical protein
VDPLRKGKIRACQIRTAGQVNIANVFVPFYQTIRKEYVGVVVNPQMEQEPTVGDEVATITAIMGEALDLGLRHSLFTQDDVDAFEPSLVFTIPRLAVLLLVFRLLVSRRG